MAIGIYSSWSADVWDFGTTEQYPALKYSDGTVMPNQGREPPENISQMPQVEIAGVPTSIVDEGESITLTTSLQSNASNIPIELSLVASIGRELADRTYNPKQCDDRSAGRLYTC